MQTYQHVTLLSSYGRYILWYDGSFFGFKSPYESVMFLWHIDERIGCQVVLNEKGVIMDFENEKLL
jgi:hypothetical protein